MSLRDRAFRPVLILALVAGTAVLSACSFTPLYSESGKADARFELAYAEPDSRLEQIVLQDLAFRLGKSRLEDAPLVDVVVSAGSRRVGRTSSGSPATTYEAIVTAGVTVTRQTLAADGTVGVETVYSVSRSAAASYTTNGQRLADQQALEDANERAAHAVADTLRLLLAANLPGKL